MKKFAINHGELSNPIQKNTIKILSQFLLDYTLEYPACFKTGEEKLTDEFRPIYIGTKFVYRLICHYNSPPFFKACTYIWQTCWAG